MYKALEVEDILSRKKLIMLNGDNKKEAKRESVRIKRIVYDLHDVIVDSKRVVLLNMNSLFYLNLKTGRGVIQNLEAIR